MQLSNCLRIAAYNLSARKRHTIWVFLNILLLSVVVVVWLVLSISLRNAHNAYIYGTASENYESILLSLDNEGACVQNKAYEQLNEAKAWDTLEPPIITAVPDLPTVLQKKNWTFVNNQYVDLRINGIDHQGIDDCSYDFKEAFDAGKPAYTYTVPFYISVVYYDSVFSENDIKEFSYRYPDADYLLAGSLEIQDDSLLISDYMLTKFGITEDLDKLIGQTISIVVEGKTLLDSCKISGILDSRLFRCGGLTDSPQIFVHGTPSMTKQLQITKAEAILPIRSYSDSVDVLEKLEQLGCNVSLLSWKRAEYFYNIQSVHLLIERLLSVFEILIFIAIAMNLYSILLNAANSRCEQFGILKSIGMHYSSLYVISYLELILISLIAVGSAMFLAEVLLQFMDKLLFVLINVHLKVSFAQFLHIGLATLSVLFVLFMLIESLILHRFLSRQPALLLRGK